MFKKRNLIFLSLLILGVLLLTGCWLIPTTTYTVTFDSQGGSAVDLQTVKDGKLLTEPTAPTKTGYTFAGWYKESGCTNTWYFTTDKVTSDITLYAKWTTNTYTVTFNKNGGDTEANPRIKVVAYGGNVGTLPTPPTKTGYTFTGWNTKASGSGTDFKATTTVTANITVYAQWTISTYTVTYDGNGSTGGAVPTDPSSPYEYGATVTVLHNTGTLVKTGYTFDGWNTAADGNGTDQAEGSTFAMGASDVTLFAKWKSSDATLSDLSLSSGTLDPSFASATISYTVEVTNNIISITVTPTATDSNATIKVNNVIVASGSASGAISLDVGENTITTVVTAQDGTTTKTYTVTVTRLAVIDIAAIPGVTAPVTGGIPITTITPTTQYTGTVTWNPADDPFQGNTAYTATITLTAKAGFTLTGVAANFFTVAGATTVTNTADSGVVTAVFPKTVLAIGDSYGGGIVAYILQSGDPGYVAGEQHGLIVATADQSGGIQWYNGSYVVTGATGIAIGTGQANTTAIVTKQGAGSYAAQLCNDLTVGDYNDWFLPSKDELHKLYLNKGAIGTGFEGAYWSSSEYSATDAWAQGFLDDTQAYGSKSESIPVRAVRAF